MKDEALRPHKHLRRKESWRYLTGFPVLELLISCTNEKRLGAELHPNLWTYVYSSSHQTAHNHCTVLSFSHVVTNTGHCPGNSTNIKNKQHYSILASKCLASCQANLSQETATFEGNPPHQNVLNASYVRICLDCSFTQISPFGLRLWSKRTLLNDT